MALFTHDQFRLEEKSFADARSVSISQCEDYVHTAYYDYSHYTGLMLSSLDYRIRMSFRVIDDRTPSGYAVSQFGQSVKRDARKLRASVDVAQRALQVDRIVWLDMYGINDAYDRFAGAVHAVDAKLIALDVLGSLVYEPIVVMEYDLTNVSIPDVKDRRFTRRPDSTVTSECSAPAVHREGRAAAARARSMDVIRSKGFFIRDYKSERRAERKLIMSESAAAKSEVHKKRRAAKRAARARALDREVKAVV